MDDPAMTPTSDLPDGFIEAIRKSREFYDTDIGKEYIQHETIVRLIAGNPDILPYFHNWALPLIPWLYGAASYTVGAQDLLDVHTVHKSPLHLDKALKIVKLIGGKTKPYVCGYSKKEQRIKKLQQMKTAIDKAINEFATQL